MAMVQPKSQKLRLGDAFRAADFYCGDHVPLLMVIAISCACTFATGSLIPDEISPSTGSLRWASAWSMPMAALPRRRSRYCCGCGTR